MERVERRRPKTRESGVSLRVRSIIRDRFSRGEMPESIADFLSLPKDIVLEVWEEVKQSYMEKFRGDEKSILAEFLLRYDRLLEEAWYLYAEAQDDAVRVRALELAMRTMGSMTKLMQDMGMLTRAPAEIRISTIMERVETYQVQLMQKAREDPALMQVLDALEEEEKEPVVLERDERT